MAQAIRHGKSVKPILISTLADVTPEDVDRCQSFSGGVSQPSENVYEEGREEKVCVDKQTLEATCSISQLEYGKIDTFLQFAGLTATPADGLTLSSFDDAKTDVYHPGKDDYAGTTEQTLWLQKMVLDSFNLEINAESRIERSFELSGDFSKELKSGNKCLIFKEDDAGSGVSGNHDIVVDDPAPVVDPNNAGVYILQLFRVRSGTATELKLTTDYTYNTGTNTITIIAGLASDHFRIWYSAASYGTSGEPFTENDSDACYLKADNVTVTLDDGVNSAIEVTKLTSLSVGVTLNRINEAVIGSDEKVLKDVETKDVTVALGGFVKNSTIEEVLMQQAGQSWGIIDPNKFDSIAMIVKIYSDATKTTFRMGYKSTGLDFSDKSKDFNANAFADKTVNLSSDNLLITDDETDL